MDGTYAPQSPDLSGFFSSPSKNQQPYQPISNTASYAPRSPNFSSFGSQPQPHHNLQQPSYQQHPAPQQSYALDGGGFYRAASYMPAIPALPQAHSSFGAPAVSPYLQQQQQQRPVKQEDPDYRPSFDGADDTYSPTMAARMRDQPGTASFSGLPAAPQVHKNPNPNNIEIKTKFPVARIKRIMQADEEVGKVAQVTPVAVSKALELFMIALVSGAAEKAREKGGKRVTAQHLKMLVEGDEQFDFLGDIVGKVADVQEGAGGAKRKEKMEGGSDSEGERRSKKGKGRRKKSDD